MKHRHTAQWIVLATVALGAQASAATLWSEETHELAFGDFNGDSMTDLLYVARDPSSNSGIMLSDGSGPNIPLQSWPSNHLGIPWHGGTYKPIVADYNGDGRADVLMQRQSPGDHYVLLSNALGQFDAINQSIPNSHGGHLWSADSHRVIAGDFNGDGRNDVFLQSVPQSGLNVVFLAGPNGSFGAAQQTWSDGHLGFGWSLSQALIHAADFTGDGKADLFVQGKPGIVIIDFDVAIPILAFKAGSFGIAHAKAPNANSEIFYTPALQIWNRSDLGVDWSPNLYEAVVGDFNGDGRADIFLQARNSGLQSRMVFANTSGQIVAGDTLQDSTLRGYSRAQGRLLAANFDGTGGAGLYVQSASPGGTNQYAAVISTSSATLVAHTAVPGASPMTQTYSDYTTYTRYNTSGQVTGTIASDPDTVLGPLRYSATRNTYNESGFLVKTEIGELATWFNENVAPGDWTGFTVFQSQEFAYDQYGRRIREQVRGTNGTIESLVQYKHNAYHQVECKAVRMNKAVFSSPQQDACELGTAGTDGPDRISKYTYDTLNQLVAEQRAVGTPLQQTYVTNEYSHRALRFQTDANGNKTELRYNEKFELEYRFYPHPEWTGHINEADFNKFTYDNNGNVLTERKRNGKWVTYTFDGNNRPYEKNLEDNTYSPDVFTDYDLRGLVLHAVFTSHSGPGLYNGFDGFGRQTSSTSTVGGSTRAIGYQFDKNGNRTRVTHPGGVYFEYEFDGLNRVKTISENGASTMLTVKYRADGRREKIERPGGATTNFARDNALRLQSFNQDFSGDTNDLTNLFSYNAANQVTQLIQSNSQYAFSGALDRAGVYVPNGRNQYATIAGQAVSYDGNGNVTADGAQGYSYDMENRLVATSGGTATSIKYDPNGRMYEYTAAGTTTQFLYDGDALVGEYVGSTLTRRYVHGDQMDQPLVQYNGASVGASYRRYLHADHQGSIIAHSESTGAVSARNKYDSYGIPDPNNDGRFGYTGQTWLKEIGLNYYKARMYSPGLGRFLQTDPIYYAADFNLYAYAGNDPFNRRDPRGLADCGGEECEEVVVTATKKKDETSQRTPVEILTAAQDAARNNEAFKPGERTFCNQATCAIASAVDAPMSDLLDSNGLPLLASAIAQNLANSEHWKEVTPEQAQELANSGTIVIAAAPGHVATVRPLNVAGDNPRSSSRGPLINDIGRNRQVAGANWSFGKNATVKYYAPR